MTEEEKKYGFRDQYELPYISDDEIQKKREKLRNMSPFDVRWDIAIPFNYRHIKNSKSTTERPVEISIEHEKMVLEIRLYHLNHGYDEAEKLANYYEDVWMVMHAPSKDFKFEEFLESYNSSK